MDTFHHQHLVAFEPQFLTAHLTLAFLEIIARQLHLISTEQRLQLFVQQGEVQGVQVFKIIVTILVLRCLFTIQEIVVERDADRIDAIDGQLHRQSFTSGRLTAGRRSGNEHQLHTLAVGYLICNLTDFLLLQGFTDLDEFIGMSADNGFVQVTHGTQSEYVLPVVVLLENVEHLVLAHEVFQTRGVIP